jgi:CRP/FNR family transcriptional regulator
MDALVQLELFFSKAKPLIYRKGEYIIRAEDVPQGVFFLKKGNVRMFTVLENGHEITLNIFKPGSYFSMIWAMTGRPNQYFFQTMTSVIVMRCAKQEILDFLISEPKILYELTKRLLIGMDTLITQMEYLLSGSAYHRTSSALLLLAKRFGETDPEGSITIKLPLVHHDIANLVGLSRETTSIFLKKLAQNKLIIYKYHSITIVNPDRLADEVNMLKEENDIPQTL